MTARDGKKGKQEGNGANSKADKSVIDSQLGEVIEGKEAIDQHTKSNSNKVAGQKDSQNKVVANREDKRDEVRGNEVAQKVVGHEDEKVVDSPPQTETPPAPKRGRKPGQPSRNKGKIQWEDKISIFNDYWVDKMSAHEIAEKYNISYPYACRIIKDPELQGLVEVQRKAVIASMEDQMMKNIPKINSILERYLDEALEERRIDMTPLPGLFTVYGITIDKQMKIEELRLKREELRIRELEAQKQAQANTGLIGDFMQIISGANTLPPREPDDEEVKG